MSLVLIDLDRFKNINDTYGHQIGDQVLRMLAHTLSVGLRRIDIIGRYGGEEFGVLLLDTPAEAQALLERTIAAQACPRIALRSHLSDRIRAFFSVKDNVGEPPVSKLHRPSAASRVAIDPTFTREGVA